MTTPPPQPLSRLDSIWLAEAVRLRELATGGSLQAPVFSEPLILSPAVDHHAAQEEWLLRRAREGGREQGLISAMHAWRRHAGVVLAVLIVLAVTSGVTAALGFFGAENRTVNVIWTLLGLIALPLIALLLWFASLLVSGHAGTGLIGRLWLWVVSRWSRPGSEREPGPDEWAARGLAVVMNRTGLGPWWLSVITHSLWLIALLATLIAMLLALSLRSYGFVLETTILAPDVFTALVEGFGALPARIGFAVPDTDMIATALSGNAVQSEAARRAWSSWLTGGLLVYAILPRLLVLAFAIMRLVVLRSRLRLDLTLPGHADLLRLEMSRNTPGVVDGAPPVPALAQVAAVHHVKSRRAILLGLELRGDISWPPARVAATRPAFIVGEVVESREQRRAVLTQFTADPPARVLLVCDARLSPDRGTLGWLVELSHYAGELRVWLLSPQEPTATRESVWRDSLAAIGLAGNRVITQESAAFEWLNRHD